MPSSNASVISGSDKSLSESSSSSKTSVIDTVTGPSHKFVIVKTKQHPDISAADNSNSAAPATECSSASDGSKKKHMTEVAKIFASRQQYRQSNTVGAVPSQTKRMPAYNIFNNKSPLVSPHYDTRFFDSSLIEMKSATSSSSTVDCSEGVEDIWVKRPEPDKKKVSKVELKLDSCVISTYHRILMKTCLHCCSQ